MTTVDLLPGTRARLDRWAADPDVRGVVWVGSRSRGHGDERSDDDLEVLLTPEAFARVTPEGSYEVERAPDGPPRLIWDAQYTTLAVLAAKAASPHDLDHWPYERARVVLDRDGQVAAAVARNAELPAAFRARRIVHAGIDAVAAATRARKTAERGHAAAAALLVAKGAKALIRVLFALEGRWAPLDHWVELELAELADAAGARAPLLDALRTGQPAPLLDAIARLEDTLAAEGFPRPEGRGALFVSLMHPAFAAERAIHGTP